MELFFYCRSNILKRKRRQNAGRCETERGNRMTIREWVDGLALRVLAEGKDPDTQLAGCYIGDLLSRAISRGVPGGVWITIMANLNVAAVALLAEIPCVVLAEGVEAPDDLREKCREEGIFLLGSGQSAYELAVAFAQMQQ